MKRHLTCIVALLIAVFAVATPVTREQAMKAAQDFVNHKTSMAKGRQMKLAHKAKPVQSVAAQEACYYVFNVGQADGYVVVSGDDRTPAILGYATSGSFSADDMPDNMRAWLAGYEEQLRYLAAHDVATTATAEQTDDHEAIEPMLTCLWNQDEPYNNLCPTDPSTGKRSVTGCVATAIAQVLYYHKHPAKTLATIPAYQTNSRKINLTAIAPTDIDWDNMIDDYSNRQGTTAQRTAVATLMKLCGAAMEMDYASSASGAWVIVDRLKSIFGYASSAKEVSRMDYRAKQWDELIYNELDGGRPVLYSGQSVGGGHQFIIDGYDANGLYHVNWGWGGYCNGYFLLSILNPDSTEGIGASTSTDGFSYQQDAVVGLTPYEDEVEWPEDPVCMTIDGLTVSGSKSLTRKSNGSFTATLQCGETINYTGATYAFDLGWGLFDTDGKLVSSVSSWTTDELGTGWYYNGWSDYVTLGQGLPDGEYKLKSLSRVAGTDTWLESKGSDRYYIDVTLSGNKATLAEAEVPVDVVDLDVSFDYDYTPTVDIPGTVFVTITNNGSFFQKEVYLQDGNSTLGGMVLEIEPGETVTLPYGYTPEKSGRRTLTFYYMEGWYTQKTLATTTVTVKTNTGTPKLTYSLDISDKTGLNVVYSPKPKAKLTVKNEGTGVFANTISLQLYRWVRNGYYSSSEYVGDYSRSLRVDVGETKEVEIELGELQDKTAYSLYFIYFNGNQWVTDYDNDFGFNTDFSQTPATVLMGDANGDGEVNVSDVTSVISFILGKDTESFNAEAADVTGDGEINVSDVTAIISIILGK